ncbi:uncharacterized protein MYCFIDRAFT_175057 [Pseudocercospora fijiensis CIRAD86]|uniref:Uncharacterized protein n=1 Tax=Pseudocercospora fijiensis (strain CIRAD86) TaxID=383855 RepID=M2Z1C9_PSEFD|nr:uncharacterized protein MYCFIDRAFT_175057 [Pseudocercospora fijiensis CIRAD86]EME83630.1 hypothetical protein MYCFIDRAFT_175057 [Pseudocercospora fijiensis CIRAD86]
MESQSGCKFPTNHCNIGFQLEVCDPHHSEMIQQQRILQLLVGFLTGTAFQPLAAVIIRRVDDILLGVEIGNLYRE